MKFVAHIKTAVLLVGERMNWPLARRRFIGQPGRRDLPVRINDNQLIM